MRDNTMTLRDLTEKTTSGPWKWAGTDDSYGGRLEGRDGVAILDTTTALAPLPHNAEFVVAARNAMPALLRVEAQARTIALEVARFLGENRPADMGTLRMWDAGLRTALETLEAETNPKP